MDGAWTKENVAELELADFVKLPIKVKAVRMDEPFACVTADGNLTHNPAGDYLLIDWEGHPYPCKRAIFEATHAEDLGEIDSDGSDAPLRFDLWPETGRFETEPKR